MPRRIRKFQRRKLKFESLEGRALLAADVFEPAIDPPLGAVVTAFDDPANPASQEIFRDNWKSSVDELVEIGMDEVTFAIYRFVDEATGQLSAGPDLSVIDEAVEYANAHQLSVTMLPVFETSIAGWRARYNPPFTSTEANTFRTGWSSLVLGLAAIPGIDRLDVASEMNDMVSNPDYNDYFLDLINDVRNVPGFTGRIGYVANWDVFPADPVHANWNIAPGDPDGGLLYLHSYLWPAVDYIGVSAYFAGEIIQYGAEESLVAGTGPIAQSTKDLMTSRWTTRFQGLADYAGSQSLPLLVQEFGLPKEDLVASRPWGDTGIYDPAEQGAVYEAALKALDGMLDNGIEGIHFWDWESAAEPHLRTYPDLQPPVAAFAIWPDDGGGGEEVFEFLSTRDSVVEGDFNNDGLSDIATFVPATGSWTASLSTPNGFGGEISWNWSNSVDWTDIVVGDFNGDGADEIAARIESSGQWWVTRPVAPGQVFIEYWGSFSANVTWEDVLVGDFNQDGRDDIAARVDQDGTWWVATSTGSVFQNQYWGSWLAYFDVTDPWDERVTWSNVSVGDFDGDGYHDDIAGRIGAISVWASGNVGDWWVSTSTGSNFNTNQWGNWSNNVAWLDVVVGDFNGDTRDDIVGRVMSSGDWWILRSVGSAFQSVYWSHWSPSQWLDVQVGDFDGDGADDVLGRHAATNTFWVSRDVGNYVTAEHWGGWCSCVDWDNVRVGDFDGDGRDDVLGNVLDSDDWWLARSDGVQFLNLYWS